MEIKEGRHSPGDGAVEAELESSWLGEFAATQAAQPWAANRLANFMQAGPGDG